MTAAAPGKSAYSRERLGLFVLLAMAAAGIVLLIVIAAPFFSGLTWALAFAVVADPAYEWVLRRTGRANLSAGLTVLGVAVLLVAPLVFVGWQTVDQASEGLAYLQQLADAKQLERVVGTNDRASEFYSWLSRNINPAQEVKRVATALGNMARGWIGSATWGIVQMLIALFALFYFFRDREDVMAVLRTALPLSRREADTFFEQVRAMTHATIYGTLVVAALQGLLGGLMFWFLGVSAPALWGFVMAVLSVIPVLGAFLVWAPVALFFAIGGEWGRAAILTGWGVFVVSTIDNVLYPVLVGREIRQHTLPVFIAVVGGLVVFGAAGLVLGPAAMAATLSLIYIIRQRTVAGASAEEKA